MIRFTSIPLVIGGAITTAASAGPVIVEYEHAADLWLVFVTDPELRAFDEFVPGVEDFNGCLVDPMIPTVMELTSGTITVSAVNDSGDPACALRDGTVAEQASDGQVVGSPSETITLRLEFDPPISAFYTYYGSLASGRFVRMSLFSGEDLIDTLNGPISLDDRAIGHGFTSSTLIDRIEFDPGSDTDGITLVGAFIGLVPLEPSLGQVTIPGYVGANDGTSTIDLDFGVKFPSPCELADVSGDATVDVVDLLLLLASWGPCPDPPAVCFDIDGSGTVDVVDLLELLANWGPC